MKHKYAPLLEVCSDQVQGTEDFARLFALIMPIENLEKLAHTEYILNPNRKIIERIFRRLAEQGIILETILANKGWINGSNLFLANRHSENEYLSEITPLLGSANIHRSLNIIQDFIEGKTELKLKADQYFKLTQSDYFHRSCVYLLFDLLLWLKQFRRNNPDKKTNINPWKSKMSNGDWISGTVTQITENPWETFHPDNSYVTISIPSKMATDNLFMENDITKIIAEPIPDGSKFLIKAISRYL